MCGQFLRMLAVAVSLWFSWKTFSQWTRTQRWNRDFFLLSCWNEQLLCSSVSNINHMKDNQSHNLIRALQDENIQQQKELTAICSFRANQIFRIICWLSIQRNSVILKHRVYEKNWMEPLWHHPQVAEDAFEATCSLYQYSTKQTWSPAGTPASFQSPLASLASANLRW